MAEVNPPLHLQARTDHTAVGDRALIETLFQVAGVADPTHLLVTENGTANMSVNVAAGRVVVDGTENSLQGFYHCVNDATKNLVIAAADATNPRIDLVVAKVEDASYSGVTNAWSLAVVTGTPAASPAAPTAPANSYTLAQISVPANDTAITNSQITDRRSTLIVGGNPPGCIVERTATQSYTDSVSADLQFTATDIRDTHAFHNPSSNSERLTVPVGLGGVYHVEFTVNWGASAAGRRQHRILVNGSEIVANRQAPVNAGVANHHLGAVLLLNAGDYVTLNCAQTSGGALTATGRASMSRIAVV